MDDNSWKYEDVRGIGSKAHDMFKFLHKKELRQGYYASDIDLSLVSKIRPGVVAYLEYKYLPSDFLTFAEVILYNELMEETKKPIYVVRGNPRGPFVICEYLGGNQTPRPPRVEYGPKIQVANWREWKQWENELRDKYEGTH